MAGVHKGPFVGEVPDITGPKERFKTHKLSDGATSVIELEFEGAMVSTGGGV